MIARATIQEIVRLFDDKRLSFSDDRTISWLRTFLLTHDLDIDKELIFNRMARRYNGSWDFLDDTAVDICCAQILFKILGGDFVTRDFPPIIIAMREAYLLENLKTAQLYFNTIKLGDPEYAKDISLGLRTLRNTGLDTETNRRDLLKFGGKYASEIAEGLIKLSDACLLTEANRQALVEGGGSCIRNVSMLISHLTVKGLLSGEHAQKNFNLVSHYAQSASKWNHNISFLKDHIQWFHRNNLSQELYELLMLDDTFTTLTADQLSTFLDFFSLSGLFSRFASAENVDWVCFLRDILHFCEYFWCANLSNSCLSPVLSDIFEHNETGVSSANIFFSALLKDGCCASIALQQKQKIMGDVINILRRNSDDPEGGIDRSIYNNIAARAAIYDAVILGETTRMDLSPGNKNEDTIILLARIIQHSDSNFILAWNDLCQQRTQKATAPTVGVGPSFFASSPLQEEKLDVNHPLDSLKNTG